MTHVLSLGAINKQTCKYVYPKIANKKDEYVCPDCNKDLILCQGEKVRPYFRHKVDSVNPCHHYSNPTETQIHKDGKMLMKSLFERKIKISFDRNCCCCKKNEVYEIPEMTETSKIEVEYRFEYNGPKIADVAYIDNGEHFCIFEICNTHKTRSENRPEPWFEIDAETLIKMVNDNSISQIKIPCIRCEKCEECIKNEIHMQMRFLEKLRLKERIQIEILQMQERNRIELLQAQERNRIELLQVQERRRIEEREQMAILQMKEIEQKLENNELLNMRNEDERTIEQKKKKHLEIEIERMKQNEIIEREIEREKENNRRIFEKDKRCGMCNVNYCKCDKPNFIKNKYNKMICNSCAKYKCMCVRITDFYKK